MSEQNLNLQLHNFMSEINTYINYCHIKYTFNCLYQNAYEFFSLCLYSSDCVYCSYFRNFLQSLFTINRVCKLSHNRVVINCLGLIWTLCFIFLWSNVDNFVYNSREIFYSETNFILQLDIFKGRNYLICCLYVAYIRNCE